jgi:hypothetical protein
MHFEHSFAAANDQKRQIITGRTTISKVQNGT